MPAPLSLFSGNKTASAHTAARRELLKTWSADWWAFLTGRDIDGTPMVITQDELDDRTPFKPFPADKPYLHALGDELLRPGSATALVDKIADVTLIDKCRQMMVSTLCMLLMYHRVLFRRGQKCLLSKQTQELAEALLRDKVRGVHSRTPAWFQQAMPLSQSPLSVARAERTGSEIICVAQNAAGRWFKGNTASITLIDEAAVQEFFEEMMEAAQPMSRRIWAITTAFHGNPGAAHFRKLMTEE